MNSTITVDEVAPFEIDEAVLRRIDLNLLVVFALVLRHGSVQAAAGRLYLGASGVSMALKRLRSLTGDALFVRGKRGLEPTAFAEALFDRIGPALSEIGSALSPKSFEPSTAEGSVRLAMSEDLEIVLASRLERALANHAPGLGLTIRQADYRRAGALLDDNAADAVLTALPAVVEARHRSLTLATTDFVVLSGPTLFPADAGLSLDAYLSVPHALVSASGLPRGRIDELLGEHGLVRKVRVVTESFAALPFLLRSGGLLANVPRAAGLELSRAFGLKLHDLPVASPTFAVALTWRARDAQSSSSKWVRDLVREEVSKVEGLARARQ